MEPVVGFFQPLLINMGVDLRRRDIGVPEHFLDDTEIAAIIEQMRGEAVPKRVRGKVFSDASCSGVFLN